MAARRERERGEIRDKILCTARTLLAERGFEGLTMRELARRIGYSPTVIYSHFRDKQALVSEMVDADYREVGERLAALRAIQDPVTRLRFIGEKFIEYSLANPNHYRAIVMTPVQDGSLGGGGDREGDIRKDAYALVLATVEEAVASGQLGAGPGDAELIAQTFIAGIHGVVSLHLMHGQDGWLPWQPVERRASHMLDSLLRGLTRGETIDIAAARGAEATKRDRSH